MKTLEKKGDHTLYKVSGLQNEAMKRYSLPVVHHGQRCSLVNYLLDGDNLPCASVVSTPPSPLESRKGPPSNEPSQASDTGQSTKKPPELPPSAMEHIIVFREHFKRDVDALAVKMGIDVAILLSIILEGFGRGLGNAVPGQRLTEQPLPTRCGGTTNEAGGGGDYDDGQR